MKTPLAAALALLAVLSASAAAPVPERFNRPASERFAPRAPTLRAESSGRAAPVVLALCPGVQTASEKEDCLLLRLGLIGSQNHDVSGLDLNLFYGGASGAERAVQLGAVNIVYGPLTGAQLGLLNVSGVLQRPNSGAAGFQIGLLGNYADSLHGAQAGLLMNRAAGASAGVQLAVGCNFSDRFRGIQLAAVNLQGDDIRGIQLGVANAGATDFAGLQLGLVNAGGDRFHGVQVAAANTVGTLDGGLQFGLANFAGDAQGWQIGRYNDARTLRGVQIGLLNVVDSADLPFLPLVRVAL